LIAAQGTRTAAPSNRPARVARGLGDDADLRDKTQEIKSILPRKVGMPTGSPTLRPTWLKQPVGDKRDNPVTRAWRTACAARSSVLSVSSMINTVAPARPAERFLQSLAKRFGTLDTARVRRDDTKAFVVQDLDVARK
jgi:hypothetical protein